MRSAGAVGSVKLVAGEVVGGAGACNIAGNVDTIAARDDPFGAGGAVVEWQFWAVAER
jgi:hypothetical protein